MFKVTVGGTTEIWANERRADFDILDPVSNAVIGNILTAHYGVDVEQLTIEEIVGTKAQITAANLALTLNEKREGVFCDAIVNQYGETVLAKLQTKQGIVLEQKRLEAGIAAIKEPALQGPDGVLFLLYQNNPDATNQEAFDALDIQDEELRAYAEAVTFGLVPQTVYPDVTPTTVLLEEITTLQTQ